MKKIRQLVAICLSTCILLGYADLKSYQKELVKKDAKLEEKNSGLVKDAPL